MVKDKTYTEPLLKITDDRFEAENLLYYRLFLLVGPVRLHFCVIDSETNRCMALESYATDVNPDSQLFAEKLSSIVENHPYLPARFWKSVHVCIANDKFTLIPLSLYKEANALNYLQLNCGVDTEIENISEYVHKQAGIVNIFAVNDQYHRWIKWFYPGKNVQFMHHTTPLIEACLRQPSGGYQASVLLCVGLEFMSVIVRDGSHLRFCNKFFFKTDEDFLYYIFLVMDELDLGHTTTIKVYGELNSHSPKFTGLKKYFPNVFFGQRPSNIHFGYVFDELPEHNYFDLFSVSYCL